MLRLCLLPDDVKNPEHLESQKFSVPLDPSFLSAHEAQIDRLFLHFDVRTYPVFSAPPRSSLPGISLFSCKRSLREA